ncbi:hypothetical protein OKA05_28125 [Luteolibacter arcticus]|uniref:HEAT repeat domain-containing protein n=1 Tax=Luteolibacter arcticus TaxID=1581411 RepID=A0ABT3GSD9_9BACT|nr:hypothetical protein [Luteolibacter arcticus]MCW1926451.1 hypothetical protein [Luteolibacter arcticus]
MLPRTFLPAGCLILAMIAGWAARQAESPSAEAKQAAEPEAAAPATGAPPMPAALEPDAIRFWLADHLIDATPGQMEDIAARLLAIPDVNARSWCGLFSCWFEKDAATAWTFASVKPDLRSIALEEWAALDPAAARAAIDSASMDDWRALVGGAVRRDVEETFRLLDKALADGIEVKSFYQEGLGLENRHFAELASRDPEAATLWVERLGIASKDIAGALLWGRLKKDPAAAREWLNKQEDRVEILKDLASVAARTNSYSPAVVDFIAEFMPPGNARIEALQALLSGLAWRDPEFAAKEAARVIPDPSVRADMIAGIASRIADSEFNKAWSLLESLGPSVQWSLRTSIPGVELQAGSDSGALSPPIHYLSGFFGPQRNTPANVKDYLLLRLIESDQDEAIRLMEGIPAAQFLDEGKSAILLWMERSPEEAVRWLAGKLGTEDGYTSREAWNQIEFKLRGFNPLERAALIKTLPPGSVRTELVTQRAMEMADDDPLAALEYARKTDTAEQPVVWAYLSWSQSDPSIALKHLSEDPDAPVAAWSAVTGSVIDDFPDEVTHALLTLPISAGRDAAIAKILEWPDDVDPVKTVTLALALGDAGKRKNAFEMALSRVSLDQHLVRDPATAETLRNQLEEAAQLSEAERQQFLERINLEFTTTP